VGAYVNQTIYLSDALFQPNAAPSSSVFGAAGVLVEETFHFLDSLVGSDTVGDEGEYAKNLIFAVPLSDSELNRIKSEDDRGSISVDGQQILAELAFDYAGNTLGTARAVTLSSSTTTFQDWVGSADTNDYYRFSLGGSSNLNLSLTGLTANADVQLLNSAGTVIRSSTAGGSSSEFITQQLAAGTYYVRVYPFSSNSTYYNLGLSAIPVVPPTPPVPPIPPNGFSSVYGYGLINAAAAVARAIGQSTPFADVPNLGGNNWGNDLVNAPESWARGYTGQGVVVAVVDTGVDYNHVDLNDNIWVNTREIAGNGIDDDGNGYIDDVRGWDFVDRDNTPLDGGSHGTHVAGTIAAENNGLGVTGVAYNARIMAVRVLGPNGGTYQDVASGIRYAANNGANVINLSLGGGYSADIESAIQYASSRGSIVVMAAGNDGLSQPGNPARIATQYGLSVGAVDINRNIASFSNRAGSDSALQHIVAPGVNVYSTTPGNTYRFLNGTSMATPHVAGVIALMLSANRSLTPTQVRSIVTSSASRLSQSSTGSLGVNTVTGSNIPQGIGISVSSNLPDANSLNDFASLDYQTVTSGANPSTTNLTTPSQNVGLIQTTVSNVVSSESTRKPVSTSKPLNVARNILDIFGNEILDSSLVNQSDWVLGTI
jgi:subtilisin family serine protease